MNEKIENEFLSIAIKLADEILQTSEKDEFGLKWKTITFEYPDKYKQDYSIDLYSGVSGISFFFLELFKKTNTIKYLDTAIQSANWVIDSNKKNQNNNYAFYTGALGVCCLLAQIYWMTGEPTYLNHAIEFAIPGSDNFLEENYYTNNGFFEGRSGSLLALLSIYEITQKEEILEHIDKFIGKLIQDIKIRPEGISWVSRNLNIKPLAGFGFGNAGIAYVFLELGKYLNNPAFFSIAEKAIEYENSLWDNHLQNWPDFRKEIANASDFINFKEELRNENLDFFIKPEDDISLVNGTAGIGLTRLQAYQVLKKQMYLDDFNKALSKIEQTNCKKNNGIEENTSKIIFYYRASQVLNDKSYFEKAQQLLKHIIEDNDNKLDCSLFGGKSGIAYLAMLLSDNSPISSIFLPSNESKSISKISSERYPNINIQMAELKEICFKNRFNRTFVLIEKIDNPFLKDDLRTVNFNDTYNFKVFIERSKNEQLKDCFNLEYEKYSMEIAIQNTALLHIKEALYLEDIQFLFNLQDDQFQNIVLILNPEARIIKTCWDWISPINPETNEPIHFTDNLNNEKAEFDNLIYPISELNSIKEKKLTVLGSLIAGIFENPKIIKKAIDEILNAFEIESDDEIPVIKKMAVDYIYKYIEEGILLFITRKESRSTIDPLP